MHATFTTNPGKSLTIEVAGRAHLRIPLRTHLITEADRIEEVVQKYVAPHLQPGDTLFISERIVAISQGRAYPIDTVRPRSLAYLLSRFVTKTPAGIGLGSPWTMELALREAGTPKILFAALIGGMAKAMGVKGVFYRIAGKGIAAIDGPCSYTIPPFNTYAKLGPRDPHGVARRIAHALGIPVVIIDANDFGVVVLGKSHHGIKDKWCSAVFRDNPLGQTDEQTPLCIVRSI